MPLYDFECETCEEKIEDIVPIETKKIECEACGGSMIRIACAGAAVLTNIIPSYPGCLKHRAGYVHSHGDKPASKIMSGPAGCSRPK